MRAADPADCEGIGEVCAEAWRLGDGEHCPPEVLDEELDLRRDYWSMVGRRPNMLHTHFRGPVLVAEQAGQFVGFITLGPDVGPPGASPVERQDRRQVYSLYVDPATWGQGCAQALMAEAIASLALRFPSAVLWTHATNARARRFFARSGWSETGNEGVDTWLDPVDHTYLHGQEFAVVEYGRTLSSSSQPIQ